jgi:hypothetical protein
MDTQWNKGHNWKRRELKRLLAEVTRLYEWEYDPYEDMCEVMEKMWDITATLPLNDGSRIYARQGLELLREEDYNQQRKDALWEVYG